MCGIAGIFNMDTTTPVAASDLETMVATLAHRGPDADGARVYCGKTGLGHRRLAVLDLVPESNQPFEIDDGALAITFNGEIYNYIELRDELQRHGHEFRTKSDTEVLLRAYAEWGEGVADRLNGMWAFAIYDARRDVLFCSRDRFGIKPFHYAQRGGRLLFGSEVKAILSVAPALARPNYESLSLQLRYSVSASTPETCFEGIHRLPPAHNMTVSRAGISLERYWDYPTETETDLTPDEAAEGLRERLVEALRLRLRSDVPVGATLSAGLDSSSVVCLLRTVHEGVFDTFTASYGGGWFDESAEAETLARSLGMRPNLLPAVDEDFLPTMQDIVRHLETPIAHPAAFPLWNIMREARRKVTVLLEGQGADELLAGYMFSFPHAAAEQLRHGSIRGAASIVSYRVRDAGPVSTALWIGRAMAPGLHGWYRHWRGDERLYAGGPLADYRHQRLSVRRDPPMRDRLNRHLRHQHEVTLVDLLQYEDAISMAHSLESRLPFTDVALVEYVFRLPGRFKFNNGRTKAVLRDAVRRDVPSEIISSRRKLGFPTPIAEWFRERPEITVDPVLRAPACRERGLFDPAVLNAVLDDHRAGRRDHSYNIFRWLITELWFREFID